MKNDQKVKKWDRVAHPQNKGEGILSVGYRLPGDLICKLLKVNYSPYDMKLIGSKLNNGTQVCPE